MTIGQIGTRQHSQYLLQRELRIYTNIENHMYRTIEQHYKQKSLPTDELGCAAAK